MAYDANHHQSFSERVRNLARSINNNRLEALALDDIYIQETVSGTHAAFVDTNISTAAELVDMVVLGRRIGTCLAMDGQTGTNANEDQTARLTPFLQ